MPARQLPLSSTDSLHGVVIQRLPAFALAKMAVAGDAQAVLPGAAPPIGAELRRAGPAVEYHAATVQLVLHRADTEAYVIALAEAEPGVHVILRHGADDTPDARPQVRPLSPPRRLRCRTTPTVEMKLWRRSPCQRAWSPG